MAGADTVTQPEPCPHLRKSEAGLALQQSCGVTLGSLLPLSEPRFPTANIPSLPHCHPGPQGLHSQASGLCTCCSLFLQCFSLGLAGKLLSLLQSGAPASPIYQILPESSRQR